MTPAGLWIQRCRAVHNLTENRLAPDYRSSSPPKSRRKILFGNWVVGQTDNGLGGEHIGWVGRVVECFCDHLKQERK